MSTMWVNFQISYDPHAKFTGIPRMFSKGPSRFQSIDVW